jgi:predicted RNA-binding protein with TRAM domain
LEDRDTYSTGQGPQNTGYSRGYGSRGSSGFRGPRPFRPSPVRVGEEYDVKIESLSRRGDTGVAKVQGLVIFVASTKVGDSVRIRITRVGRGYATAEVIGNQTLEQASSQEQESQMSQDSEDEAPLEDEDGSQGDDSLE